MDDEQHPHATHNECASDHIPHSKRRQEENQHAANHRSHLNRAPVHTGLYEWRGIYSILVSHNGRADRV